VVEDAAPEVSVSSPLDGSIFAEGESVELSGTATDVEDGDLSGAIAWSSDRDGPLGDGSSLSVSTLSAGVHVLTATVVDSALQSASASVSVAVEPTVVDGPAAVSIASPLDGAVFAEGDTVEL